MPNVPVKLQPAGHFARHRVGPYAAVIAYIVGLVRKGGTAIRHEDAKRSIRILDCVTEEQLERMVAQARRGYVGRNAPTPGAIPMGAKSTCDVIRFAMIRLGMPVEGVSNVGTDRPPLPDSIDAAAAEFADARTDVRQLAAAVAALAGYSVEELASHWGVDGMACRAYVGSAGIVREQLKDIMKRAHAIEGKKEPVDGVDEEDEG